MSDQTAGIQAELERKVASAISKLALADHSNDELADAYNAALNVQMELKRPIRIAVGGEFSSGKSTFVEMLLGQHVVQTQASASALPTVYFQHSNTPRFKAVGPDQSRDITDVDSLSEAEMRELDYIEVMVDVPFLKQFEVFDTPGTSDPTRSVDQLLTVANRVDFIIWCTNATQAWRESERRMWANMPPELKSRSLLLVTHVDLPSIKASKDRLMKRLDKEASTLFGKVIPMELLSAQNARDAAGNVVDQAAWTSSGGEECLATMNATSAEIRADYIKIAQRDLELKIIPFAKDNAPSTKPFVAHWEHELHSIKAGDVDANGTDVALSYLKLLDGALEFLNGDSKPSTTDINKLVGRIEEAKGYIGEVLLQKDAYANSEQTHSVITQLDWEFHHISMLA